MSDVISQYQSWKQQGEDLRVKAKQAMESRFRELLAEAVRIAEEYRIDFGSVLKPHSPVTTFRYKATARGAAKKASKSRGKAEETQQPRSEPAAAKANPKISGLQKRLASAKKKVDEAKAANKPVRALEDRVYEIEDELRLAAQA